METTSETRPKSFLKQNKLIISLFCFVIILTFIIAILFLANQNKDKNIDSENSNRAEVNTDSMNNQKPEEQLLMLGNNICPDRIEFGEVSYAYIGNQKYGFTDAQKIWAEDNCPNMLTNTRGSTPDVNGSVPWSYNGTSWISNGNAPECNNPLEIVTPVDISLVSGMLYPGQYRGGDYKPHGGFAFDNQSNNSVNVYLPDDAVLWRAVRYNEMDDVQYLVDFITPCGIAYRFDHILTPSDKLMDVLNTLPEPNESTRTTLINPAVEFKKRDLIATEVGFRNPLNVGFDLGVYDLRQRNAISLNDAEWATLHKDESELAYYGICWLDYLAGNDKVTARALKARGAYADEGKESDYCN